MQKITQSMQAILTRFQRPVAFEQISDDGDELTEAINNDVHTHENDWQLKDEPDAEKLDAFWDEVLADIGPDSTEINKESS